MFFNTKFVAQEKNLEKPFSQRLKIIKDQAFIVDKKAKALVHNSGKLPRHCPRKGVALCNKTSAEAKIFSLLYTNAETFLSPYVFA
jgi:hypothetical protein